MNTTQKILLIAPTAFGYTKHIHDALQHYPTRVAHILYLDDPAFHYKNFFHKIQNFLSKAMLNKNLKKTFVDDRIKQGIQELGTQDFIFIIRPDILMDSTLSLLRKNTSRFVAYYYDSARRFPRKVAIKDYFDKVYSYDKLDVAAHGFDFLTNYIFDEGVHTSYEYLFYNISTHDYRYPIIENLGKYIQEKGWSSKIQVYTPDAILSDGVEIIHAHKSIAEVATLMDKSKIIVEIQRTEQVGLSFRVFEALGKQKKLITTNRDIVHYDFYDPQNILVIDPQHLVIPEAFVESPYKAVSSTILDQYRLDHWVQKVFELS